MSFRAKTSSADWRPTDWERQGHRQELTKCSTVATNGKQKGCWSGRDGEWQWPEEEEVAKAKSRGISWRSASAVVIRLKVYSSPAADRHKASWILANRQSLVLPPWPKSFLALYPVPQHFLFTI